jgi:hypothetical protein
MLRTRICIVKTGKDWQIMKKPGISGLFQVPQRLYR